MPPLLAPSSLSAALPSQQTLTQKDIRTLEQTRQRLYQLTNSLSALQTTIHQSPHDALPLWPSLQSLSAIIAQNLSSLTSHLSADGSAQLLSNLAAAPLPSFPAQQHEEILTQLLRKKVEVGVEDAEEEAAREGRRVSDIDRKLWKWAAPKVNELARERDWEGEFTMEEREMGVENVITGLRRNLEDESDSEEESGEGKAKKDRETGAAGKAEPAMPMDSWLRFMSTGRVTGLGAGT